MHIIIMPCSQVLKWQNTFKEGARIFANIVNILNVDVHQCQYWRTLKNNRFAILNSAAGD